MTRLDRQARARRDGEIVARYRGGETLDQVARAVGMSPTGVWRALDRLGALPSAEVMAQRRGRVRRARSGPRPVWPDCPAHLQRDYRKVRAVIGSAAARAQLMKLSGFTPERGGAASLSEGVM